MRTASTTASRVHANISARNIQPIQNLKVSSLVLKKLPLLGIGMDSNVINQMRVANDGTIQAPITTGSIATPIQFLQKFLPGLVKVLTAARRIDDILGFSVIGDWADEKIVLTELEQEGKAIPYGDYTNIPLSNWNVNFDDRTIVRFELGMKVTRLEEERAAKINVNTATEKRQAAALLLEVERNKVGFFGFNSGNNRTYGLLNDPNLPGYTNFPNGASSSPAWSTKTFLEITADIRTMFKTLRTQSLDQVDPGKIPTTMVLPTEVIDYLTVTTTLGDGSVRDWLTKTFPKCRVVSAPEFYQANGGVNVAYLFADYVDDQSTDDGRTFIQTIPAKFQILGVARDPKGLVEDYTNATAGVFCKRAFAVVRYSGC